MSLAQYGLGFVIVLVAACLQGSVGIGFSLIAGPCLLLIDPAFVPAPVLCGLLALTILMSGREHRMADQSGLRWAVAGRIPGTAIGIATLLLLPAGGLNLMVGILVLVAVAMSTSWLRLSPEPRTLFAAGLISGVMETTSSVGGPPVALAYRRSAPPVIRSTMSVFFVLGATISLAALALAGKFSEHQLTLSLTLLPGVVVGFLLSSRVTPRVDRRGVGPAVLVVSALAGALVVLRQLL